MDLNELKYEPLTWREASVKLGMSHYWAASQRTKAPKFFSVGRIINEYDWEALKVLRKHPMIHADRKRSLLRRIGAPIQSVGEPPIEPKKRVNKPVTVTDLLDSVLYPDPDSKSILLIRDKKQTSLSVTEDTIVRLAKKLSKAVEIIKFMRGIKPEGSDWSNA